MSATLFLLTCLGAPRAAAPGPRQPPAATPEASSGSETAAVSRGPYALGLSLGRTMASLDLSVAELEIVARGLKDAASGRPDLTPEDVGPQLNALRRARAPRAVQKEKARSAAFLEMAERESGAVRTESGLVYLDVKEGTGESPPPDATVKAGYRGTLIDGFEFSRSPASGDNAQRLRLGELIPCLREGVQRMKVGGRARLVCPSTLAYGDRGRQNIPGGAALVFDVELVEVVSVAQPPLPPSRKLLPTATPH